jgi:TctA family transporter
MNKEKQIGAWTSLTIGLPTGILAVGIGILFPSMITGEGLLTLVFLSSNNIAVIGLLISFPIALWFGGQKLVTDIKLRRRALLVTVKYTLFVNAIIWTIFIGTHWITNDTFDLFLGLLFPLGLATFSIILTPVTIGLIIYWTAKKRIERSLPAHNKMLLQ